MMKNRIQLNFIVCFLSLFIPVSFACGLPRMDGEMDAGNSYISLCEMVNGLSKENGFCLVEVDISGRNGIQIEGDASIENSVKKNVTLVVDGKFTILNSMTKIRPKDGCGNISRRIEIVRSVGVQRQGGSQSYLNLNPLLSARPIDIKHIKSLQDGGILEKGEIEKKEKFLFLVIGKDKDLFNWSFIGPFKNEKRQEMIEFSEVFSHWHGKSSKALDPRKDMLYSKNKMVSMLGLVILGKEGNVSARDFLNNSLLKKDDASILDGLCYALVVNNKVKETFSSNMIDFVKNGDAQIVQVAMTHMSEMLNNHFMKVIFAKDPHFISELEAAAATRGEAAAPLLATLQKIKQALASKDPSPPSLGNEKKSDLSTPAEDKNKK